MFNRLRSYDRRVYCETQQRVDAAAERVKAHPVLERIQQMPNLFVIFTALVLGVFFGLLDFLAQT